MVRLLATTVLVAASLASSRVSAIVDPHDDTEAPRRCRSCHTSGIHDAGRSPGDYRLLTETIDGVCLICHLEDDCCEVGQQHLVYLGRHTHPSGFDEDEVGHRYRPRELPTFGGRITCNTCHLHERGRPRDYKLLRRVVIRDTGVDWTPLCEDCHEGY